MPIITNNNFVMDNFSTRIERLMQINNKIESLQSVLQLPEHLYEWALTCEATFSNLSVKYGATNNRKQSATTRVDICLEKMDKEYQYFKSLALNIYKDEPVFLADFQFSTPYPRDRYLKLQKVEHILRIVADHKDQDLAIEMPEVIVERLTAAKDEVLEALQKQESAKKELKHIKAEYDQRFQEDTRNLQLLKAWWLSMYFENLLKITSIGMVVPKTRGTGKRINAPENLQYSISSSEFSWTSETKATSYELEIKKSNANAEFTKIYSGKKQVFYHKLSAGKYFAKVRARNKKGYGEWSEELEIIV